MLDDALAELMEERQPRRLRNLKLTRLEVASEDNDWIAIPLWLDFKKTIAAGQRLGVVVETYKNNHLFDDEGMVVLRGGDQ
jgi:hypothetical protein